MTHESIDDDNVDDEGEDDDVDDDGDDDRWACLSTFRMTRHDSVRP